MRFALLAALTLQITYSTSTDLVVVPVTVTNQAGRPVTSLTVDAFRVEDEGRLRKLSLFSAESPATFLLLVDRSASTQPKTQLLTEGVRGFLADGDPLDDVWLQTFNDVVDRRTLAQSKSQFDQILQAPPAGGTAAFDALIDAAHSLRDANHQRKVIVLISDGNDTESKNSFGAAEAAIRQSGATVFFVRIQGPDRARSVSRLSALTAASGGSSLTVETPQQANDTLRRLRSDLRHQYVLGFISDAKGEAPRRIKVSARGRGLRVRTREYYVPSGR